MNLEHKDIFFEIIDFERNPDKVTNYFPEIVNSLQPHRTFIILFVFPPDEIIID